jgi:hypothetical protein
MVLTFESICMCEDDLDKRACRIPIYQICSLTLLTQVQIHNDILACCDKARRVDAPQEWDPLACVYSNFFTLFMS